MVDKERLRESVRRTVELIRDGQDTLSSRVVMARLIIPLLQLLETMESDKQHRWLTLAEVMARCGGRNRKFFDKALVSLGDRSRLEKWRDDDLAEQTAEGVWLISRLCLPAEAAAGEAAPATTGAPEPDLQAHAAAIADRVLRGR